jgi:hypothetical protein
MKSLVTRAYRKRFIVFMGAIVVKQQTLDVGPQFPLNRRIRLQRVWATMTDTLIAFAPNPYQPTGWLWNIISPV